MHPFRPNRIQSNAGTESSITVLKLEQLASDTPSKSSRDFDDLSDIAFLSPGSRNEVNFTFQEQRNFGNGSNVSYLPKSQFSRQSIDIKPTENDDEHNLSYQGSQRRRQMSGNTDEVSSLGSSLSEEVKRNEEDDLFPFKNITHHEETCSPGMSFQDVSTPKADLSDYTDLLGLNKIQSQPIQFAFSDLADRDLTKPDPLLEAFNKKTTSFADSAMYGGLVHSNSSNPRELSLLIKRSNDSPQFHKLLNEKDLQIPALDSVSESHEDTLDGSPEADSTNNPSGARPSIFARQARKERKGITSAPNQLRGLKTKSERLPEGVKPTKFADEDSEKDSKECQSPGLESKKLKRNNSSEDLANEAQRNKNESPKVEVSKFDVEALTRPYYSDSDIKYSSSADVLEKQE